MSAQPALSHFRTTSQPGCPTSDLRALVEAVRHQANAVLGQQRVGAHTVDAACIIYDRANAMATLLFDAIRADQGEAEAQAKSAVEFAA